MATKAERLRRAGQLRPALGIYESLSKLESNEARWPHLAGEMCRQLRDKPAAAAHFARAAAIHEQQGFLAKAAALCQVLIALDPANAEGHAILKRCDSGVRAPRLSQIMRPSVVPKRTEWEPEQTAEQNPATAPASSASKGSPTRPTPQESPAQPAAPAAQPKRRKQSKIRVTQRVSLPKGLETQASDAYAAISDEPDDSTTKLTDEDDRWLGDPTVTDPELLALHSEDEIPSTDLDDDAQPHADEIPPTDLDDDGQTDLDEILLTDADEILLTDADEILLTDEDDDAPTDEDDDAPTDEDDDRPTDEDEPQVFGDTSVVILVDAEDVAPPPKRPRPKRITARSIQTLLKGELQAWDDPEVLEQMTQDYLRSESPHPRKAAALLMRLGELATTRGASLAERIGRYQDVLVQDPDHLDGLRVLEQLYADSGNASEQRDTLARLAPLEATRAARLRAYERLAHVCEQLDDQPGITAAWEQVLELEELHEGALGRLEGAYRSAEKWDALDRVHQRRLMGLSEPDEQADRYVTAGQDAAAGDRPELARRYYEDALEQVPDHVGALIAGVDLRHQLKEVSEALAEGKALLETRGDSLWEHERLALRHRLGLLHQELGEHEEALDSFAQVLALDDQHQGALSGMVAVAAPLQVWDAVAEASRQLAALSTSEKRSKKLWVSLGDLYDQELGDPMAAAKAYHEAAKLQPADPTLWRLCAKHYTAARLWAPAVEVLRALAPLEESPAAQATAYFDAGSLSQQELDDEEGALALYELALDAHPTAQLAAFLAVDGLHTKRQDWSALEQAYRRMIDRQQGLDQERLHIHLHDNLGEIYRSRLNDYDRAITCFEEAARHDPGNPRRHHIIAELCEHSELDRLPEAIEHRQLLRSLGGTDFEHLHALISLYRRTDQQDLAWCLTGALRVQEQADEEESRFYDAHRPAVLPSPNRPLAPAHWDGALGGQADPTSLATLCGLLGPALAEHRASRERTLTKGQHGWGREVDDELRFTNVFDQVTQALALPLAPEFVTLAPNEADVRLVLVMSSQGLQPLWIAPTKQLLRRGHAELAFRLAREFSYLRPEHLLLLLVSELAELEGLLHAVLHMADSGHRPDGIPKRSLEKSARLLEKQFPTKLRPLILEAAEATVAEGGLLALPQWCAAVAETANRVGLLLCSDLEVAIRSIRHNQPRPGAPASTHQRTALLRFAVSDDYAKLRQALGLTITA